MKNIQKLLNDIEKAIVKWNERSMFTLKTVKNLSKSDLDTLELYAHNYDGYAFPGLMKPLGRIKDVLDAYGLTTAK